MSRGAPQIQCGSGRCRRELDRVFILEQASFLNQPPSEQEFMKVTGKTRIQFILADPVAQVIASHKLNQGFEADGLDIAVCPLHVRAEDLALVVQGIRRMHNVLGFGVTIPHKIAVIPLVDELTARARHIGSVNMVVRRSDGSLLGDNLDGQGYINGLALDGIEVRGKRVLQFGAGGAGRALACSFAEAGVNELGIRNRDAARAEALAQQVRNAYPQLQVRASVSRAEHDVAQADLIVNATSQGMRADDAPLFDYSVLTSDKQVSEIIMVPEITPLLEAALAKGCKTGYGRRMVEAQYPLLCELLKIGAYA